MFTTATAFQEFAFIVKYCPFTSTVGAHSLFLINYKQKKNSLVFRTYDYPKRCAQINFISRMTSIMHKNDVGCWSWFYMTPNPKVSACGEPGLVDRVLASHAGSRGFDSQRGHMSERFFRSNRPGYPHPVSSELGNSGIRVASVIAVSLNVDGGVRLIKPPKLCMCTQNTTNTTRTDARRRVWGQWSRTAEPLGERRYENWNTHTSVRIMVVSAYLSGMSLVYVRADQNCFSSGPFSVKTGLNDIT